MSVTYFKRYRMEVDLRRPWRPPRLPEGYRYVGWSPDRLDDHVEAKFQSFAGEIDSGVFDCLASEEGCRRLMTEIAHKPGFLPEATWLVELDHGPGEEPEICGAIQGIRVTARYGAIQNVGVIPWRRARGLGAALVQAALFGFRVSGLQRACLEVTAENVGAVRMYQRLGFRRVKTVYKPVELVAG